MAPPGGPRGTDAAILHTSAADTPGPGPVPEDVREHRHSYRIESVAARLMPERDLGDVAVGVHRRLEQAAGALLGMPGELDLARRLHQLAPRQREDRVAVGGPERIPQAPLLVVRLELGDLDSHYGGRRQRDSDPAGRVIHRHLGSAVEVEAGQDLARHHHERALGRAEPAVLRTITTSRSMVSLVTRRATARVCSTTTAWLTLVSPARWRSGAGAPRDAAPDQHRDGEEQHRRAPAARPGRRGDLSATVRHRGLDLADLAGRAAQPLDAGGGDGVVVLDPDADVVVALAPPAAPWRSSRGSSACRAGCRAAAC